MAQVQVNVIRNENGPIFREDYYNITIGEYRPVQREVVEVKAIDNDAEEVSTVDRSTIDKRDMVILL